MSAFSGAGPINLFRIQYVITCFIKNSLNASLNLSMKLSMKHSMDFRAHHVHPHPMVFAFVFLTFATFPSNLMESIKGGGLPLLLWRRPKAASIKLDGNVANVRKTYANMALSNIRAFGYLVDFIIFSVRFPRSYLFSEIQYPI